MPHLPDYDSFSRACAGDRVGRLVPVYRKLVSDTLTPVSAYCRITAEDSGETDRRAFLFESVVGGERVGRFSFVGADPFLAIEAHGRTVRISALGEDPLGNAPAVATGEPRSVDDPLAELESLL